LIEKGLFGKDILKVIKVTVLSILLAHFYKSQAILFNMNIKNGKKKKKKYLYQILLNETFGFQFQISLQGV